MTVRRTQLGLAAAGSVLVALLAAVLLRQRGDGLDLGEGPAVQQVTGGDMAQARSGEPETSVVTRSDAGPAAGSRVENREVLTPPAHVPAPGPVDLIIIDEEGSGLFDRARSPLTPDVIFWLEPVLIEGRNIPATVPPGAQRLRRLGSRVSSTPGWYTAFDRPAGDAHVALLLGDRIVSIEPVPPGVDEVVLVATGAEIAALLCTVRGVIAGLDQVGRHVRVLPIGRAGQVLAPILGEGDGESFTVTKIPPGRVQFSVRFDPGVLVQKLIQSAPAGGAISLGSRVRDEEQWRHRLEALGRIRQPWLVMDLELVPGEDRNLGQLVESPAGAVLLALVDDGGDPVPAHSVDVRLLTTARSSIPHPQTWTYENHAILHPLPVALLQMTVVQGDLGALSSVRPTALGPGGGSDGFPEIQCVLSPLSVVALPSDAGARLLTESGALLASDPRWSGGRFKGHLIDETTMLVPAGGYRFQSEDQGTFTAVQVPPGSFVDLRGAAAATSPLQAADRKGRGGSR